MVKSKVWLPLIALVLTAALVMTGCSSNSKSPQEALQASMAKTAEMKSYSFSGSMKIEELSFASNSDAAGVADMLSMFKDTDISWSGAYRADPMHLEMQLSVALKGDMAVTMNIPIIMKEEKLWIKIPNIPFLPMPEDIAGKKFLELDLKQLAEESGQPMPELDPAKSQQFVNDVLAIIFNNIEEEQYLSDVKASEAGLPEDAGVKKVVQFKMTKDQVEPFAKTVIEKIAPAFLDLLSDHAEYRDMLGLTQEDIDSAKADLGKGTPDDFATGMEEFKKTVKSLEVTSNMGMDAKQFLVYSDLHVRTEVDAEGDALTLAFKVVSQTKDINKDVVLEYPDGPADVITMEEFEEQMGAMYSM